MSDPARPQPQPREAFAHFAALTTRWMDNDVYGHMNNVVHYSLFDTAVNRLLIDAGALDIHAGAVIGLVVHTQCHYFDSLAFPQTVHAGIRVEQLGRSSVRYGIGLFADTAGRTAAIGQFTHVYVDRATRRPVPLPEALRRVLEPLVVSSVASNPVA
jgi:acyl-CoA thioester hydrolase